MKLDKIIIIAALLIVASANMAKSTIAVNWYSSYGIDDPDVPGYTYDLPIGSLVQLIWTPDNIIDPIDFMNPTVPQGNDKLLDSQFTTLEGAFAFIGTYPESLAGVSEAVFLSGYVYIRCFNSGSPTIGSWYGHSELVGNPLTDQDDVPFPLPPDFVDMAPTETFTLNLQVVPEPSVIALAALGAGLIGSRRIRRT